MNRFRKKDNVVSESPPVQSRPLREFNSTSTPNQRSPTKTQYRLRVIVYWFVPLAVLAVITFFGVTFARKSFIRDAVSVDNYEQVQITSPDGEINIPDLMEAYVNAMGGREALERVRSLRYDGRVTFSEHEGEFQMLIMYPDKGMLLTNPGAAYNNKSMLNGDVAWNVFEKTDGTQEIIALDQAETKALQWSLRLHNTLLDFALKEDYAGLSVKEIKYDDRHCYEIMKKMDEGGDFVAILDSETLYLLRTEETPQLSDKIDRFTIIYEDYRMVSGIVEPYKITLYRNGELDNELIINSIGINTGVISSLFEIPEELKN